MPGGRLMYRRYLRVFRIPECGFASVPLLRPARISLAAAGLFSALAYLDVYRGVNIAAD